MSPIDWATRPLKKYADFSGRAPRSEFWWYILMVIVAVVIALIIESIVGIGPVVGPYAPLTLLIAVATFVPTLAAQVRRLHDTNRSGLWLLAFYIPYGISLFLTQGATDDIAAGTADMGSIAIAGAIGLIGMVLGIVLLIFYVLGGTKGENRFGPDPYAGEPALA